jgi:hypothetical protein
LILIDAGAEYANYPATWPVPFRFRYTDRQRSQRRFTR